MLQRSPETFDPDYGYHRGCAGKVWFASRKAAKRCIRRVNDRTMNAYHCEYCGKWHIGHPRPRK